MARVEFSVQVMHCCRILSSKMVPKSFKLFRRHCAICCPKVLHKVGVLVPKALAKVGLDITIKVVDAI